MTPAARLATIAVGMSLPTPVEFFASVEADRAWDPTWSSETLLAARDAALAERRYDLPAARAALARLDATKSAEIESPTVARLVALVRAQVALREGTPESFRVCREQLASALVAPVPVESAIRGRALLTGAALAVRAGGSDDPEWMLPAAVHWLEPDCEVRVHAVNAWASWLQEVGAWHEAEHVLAGLVERRANDPVGMAVSGGSLARLLANLGRWEEARACVQRILSVHGVALPALTRLRVATLAVECDVAVGAKEALVEDVATMLRDVDDARASHLDGFAHLAAARAMQALGEPGKAHGHMAKADAIIQHPEQRTLVEYHRTKLASPTRADWEAALERIRRSLVEGTPTEGEVRIRVEAARAAAAEGKRDQALGHLDVGYSLAWHTNHPIWVRWLDEASDAVDPAGHYLRLSARLAGRSIEELALTQRHDVTIVFADMVGYSSIAPTLEPEEVMATVRGLFELAGSLLVRHRVRPLSFLGDGLLAVAEGEDHSRRAVEFAREFVERVMRTGRMRRELGDSWGQRLRAGVASGIVVVGTLGTQHKKELAAIGVTTNLAARLQGAAEPGEVVVEATTGEHAGIVAATEEVDVKGFGSAIRIHRLSARDPEGIAF